jgi:hypothetical protein
MAPIIRLSEFRRRRLSGFFTRAELNQLLSLYSRQVARGHWRDYAIRHADGKAVFAVFRHSHETALYTIVKSAPQGDPNKGEFAVLSGRMPLARGPVLGQVLAQLQKMLRHRIVLLDGERSR